MKSEGFIHRLIILAAVAVLCLLSGNRPCNASGWEKASALTQKGQFEENWFKLQAGDPDEMFKDYVSSVFYRKLYPEGLMQGQAPRKKKLSKSASAKLNDTELIIYSRLREMISEAADGTRSSTQFQVSPKELGMEKCCWTADELKILPHFSEAEIEAALLEHAFPEFDFEKKIMNALRSSCPYELYWADLYWGYSLPSYIIEFDEDGNITAVKLEDRAEFVFRIIVSEEYSYGSLPNTVRLDISKAASVKAAAGNAADIVSENAGLSDYRKLLAYCDIICKNVSYDEEAACGGGSVPYGNPWQLVYVFDGDPDTNVVCEGYSKAFQYLCDITSFKSEIECLTVTGFLNNGTSSGQGTGHMWNVLSMDDGINYIADITGCDAGGSADTGRLFLKGCCGGSYESGYLFPSSVSGLKLTYLYDDDAEMVFTKADLDLSDTDYVLPHGDACPQGGNMIWHDTVEPGCDKSGTCAYWSCRGCGRLFWDEAGRDEIISETGLIVPSPGHRIKFVKAREPEKGADGHTAYYECSACGRLFEDAEGIRELLPDEIIVRYIYNNTDSNAADSNTADSNYTGTNNAGTKSGIYKCSRQEIQSAFRLSISPGGKSIPIRLNRNTRGIKAVSLYPGDSLISAEAQNPEAVRAYVSGNDIVLKGLKENARTIITVSTRLGARICFRVRVLKGRIRTKALKLSARSAVLCKGESIKIGVMVAPVTSSQKVKYISSDKNIVRVKNGVILAKEEGNARIFVRSGTCKKTIRVTVKGLTPERR